MTSGRAYGTMYARARQNYVSEHSLTYSAKIITYNFGPRQALLQTFTRVTMCKSACVHGHNAYNSGMETKQNPLSVFVWSRIYPDYTRRINAMAHPWNIAVSFEQAAKLSLVPKD